jgi:hypothetical protein
MNRKRNKKATSSPRRPEVSVVIAPAVRDIDSINSAIKGWIVPLLVKEFLAEHGCRSAETEANSGKPTTKAIGMEDVATSYGK